MEQNCLGSCGRGPYEEHLSNIILTSGIAVKFCWSYCLMYKLACYDLYTAGNTLGIHFDKIKIWG